MWIEAHVELGEHPKTYNLATRLDINQGWAVGLLILTWHYALRFCQDGNLKKYPEAHLARMVHWPADPHLLITALTEAGFLTDAGQIVNWSDYSGRYFNEKKRRERYNEKQRAGKEAAPVASLETSQGTSNSTVHTVENNNTAQKSAKVPLSQATNDKTTTSAPTVAPVRRFEEFWSLYPRKKDKALARAAWGALKADAGLGTTIVDGLRERLAAGEFTVAEKFIPYAVRWLRRRRWEDPIKTTIVAGVMAYKRDDMCGKCHKNKRARGFVFCSDCIPGANPKGEK